MEERCACAFQASFQLRATLKQGFDHLDVAETRRTWTESSFFSRAKAC